MTKLEFRRWRENSLTKKVMKIIQEEITNREQYTLNGVPLVSFNDIQMLVEYARHVGILFGLEYIDKTVPLYLTGDDEDEEKVD